MAEYNRTQLGEDIICPRYEVLEDGTELDDPTDMNGFIDDGVGEEEITADNVSHAKETIQDPCANYEIGGSIIDS